MNNSTNLSKLSFGIVGKCWIKLQNPCWFLKLLPANILFSVSYQEATCDSDKGSLYTLFCISVRCHLQEMASSFAYNFCTFFILHNTYLLLLWYSNYAGTDNSLFIFSCCLISPLTNHVYRQLWLISLGICKYFVFMVLSWTHLKSLIL